MKEKIELRLAELKQQKEQWDKQLQDINDGRLPSIPAYFDMVYRNILMCAYQIDTLEWVLKKAM